MLGGMAFLVPAVPHVQLLKLPVPSDFNSHSLQSVPKHSNGRIVSSSWRKNLERVGFGERKDCSKAQCHRLHSPK